jgi:hypothetical protein
MSAALGISTARPMTIELVKCSRTRMTKR